MQGLLYEQFQASNPERFNEDVIFMRQKEREDLGSYFDDLFKSLKLPGVTYNGLDVIHDESKFDEILERKKEMRKIEESRLDLISASFTLSHSGESKDITLNLFFPKLIDDFFFYLNGNRYCAVYQTTDRNFYPIGEGVSLKTLLMPLAVRYNNSEMTTTDGEIIPCRTLYLDFFNSRQKSENRNLFTFFIVKFGGVQKALDFMFGHSDDGESNVYLTEDKSHLERKDYRFLSLRSGKTPLYMGFRTFTDNEKGDLILYHSLVATAASSLFNIRKGLDTIDEINYWKRKILKSPTTNINRADQTIYSLERVFDPRTYRNLREVTPENKETVFHLVRWICWNLNSLMLVDSVDVMNRRIRLYEYMLYPLLTQLSDTSYRILNSRNLDLGRLESIFSNITPMYIVSRLMTNELFRYSNSTSTLDLFNSALRWSARGPQTLGSGGGTSTGMRVVHPSYLGVFGLTNASASQPGLTGCFCPMSRKINNMFFTEENGRDVSFDYHQSMKTLFGGVLS